LTASDSWATASPIVPEERVATVAVGVEVRRCALGGQLDQALGCVDDLG